MEDSITILKPAPSMLTVWRILLTLGFFPLAFLISFFLSGVLYIFAAAAWFFCYLFFFLYYFPTLYQGLLYILSENALTIRRGVFYHYLYSIPLNRIQFTALATSPISRFFGLVTLQVVAPGAKVSLPGLSIKEARTFAKKVASFKGEAS